MNVYWFGRNMDKDLADVSDMLEDAGFYGWLLPYVAGLPDPFVRIARSLNTDQKLKYLVAVRPHTITPQYLLAITRGLDFIQKDRVRVNFVPGWKTTGAREHWFSGPTPPIDDNSTLDDRKRYLCSYIKDFKNMNGSKPYVYISGMPDDICPNMLDFADGNIVSYGLLASDKLGGYSRDAIISIPVTSIEMLRERMNHARSEGFENIMIHIDERDSLDWVLTKKIFEEIKSLKATSA